MFKTLQAKIVGGVFIVMLIAIGILGFLWQSEKVLTVKAQNELIRVEKEHADELAGAATEITRLNSINADISRKAAEDLNKAHQEHKVAINEIIAQRNSDLVIINRLRDNTKALNSKLSSLSDSARSEYATTAGNNLEECTVVLGEVVDLSRKYSAEIDFLRNAWPKQPEIESK